jgi:hypothetical protein
VTGRTGMLGVVLSMLLPGAAYAGTAVAEVRALYDHAQLADAYGRAELALDGGGLLDPERAELHALAGLSAFFLDQGSSSDRHFQALLRLEPDHRFDPFSVAPAAIAALERVRARMSAELDLVRRKQQLKPTVLRAAPRAPSFFEAWIPFGHPQFARGARTRGTVLAVSQSVFAGLSLVSLLSYYGAQARRTVEVRTPTGTVRVTEWGVLTKHQGTADAWRWVNLLSTSAFYATYGYGVADAVMSSPPAGPEQNSGLRAEGLGLAGTF